MIGRSSAKLKLKMRSRSAAQRENSFQSSSGAPSSRQTIGIGYGIAHVADELEAARRHVRVEEAVHHLAHVRPEAVGGLGREGRGDDPAQPAVLVALGREDRRPALREERGVLGAPASSASFAANWWKRRSRRSATESS